MSRSRDEDGEPNEESNRPCFEGQIVFKGDFDDDCADESD